MAKKFATKIGVRDLEILAALDRVPLTIQQICELCKSFAMPFNDKSNLRRRMRLLEQSGLVCSWPYAFATEGRSPNYFRLSREGFLLIHGYDSKLPHRRNFEEIGHGRHQHTFALSSFVVALTIWAHESNLKIINFQSENSFSIHSGEFKLQPDSGFQIEDMNGRKFSFVIELDNGSERTRSKLDVESIERKIRGYDLHQSQYSATDPGRYQVLFVTTRSQTRLLNILRTAGELMANPQRTVFLGCTLDEIKKQNPFCFPYLQDHRGLKRCLLPQLKRPRKSYVGQECEFATTPNLDASSRGKSGKFVRQ